MNFGLLGFRSSVSAEMVPKDHAAESAGMAPKDHVLESVGLLGPVSVA